MAAGMADLYSVPEKTPVTNSLHLLIFISKSFSKDELIDGLKEMAAAVHENGSKIVMQIAHAGHFAVGQLTGLMPWVASAFEGLAKTPRHEMTTEDIRALTVSFAEAARRAKVAGFDGVQIHSAHGYLLSQLLSPLFSINFNS